LQRVARRYGPVFTLRIPIFGDAVVVGDPALVRQLFTTNPDSLLNIQPNLSRLVGPGSLFALEGADHRNRRKLLTPPFHGHSVKNYEQIIEEETLAETANWPEGRQFRTLEPMMRITLNVILRAVFGADGGELDDLRRLIPGWITLGSKLALLPTPPRTFGRYSPWGRMAAARRQFDATLATLIDRALADPNLDERTDILSLMLQSTYDDGSSMSRSDIADELLTLVAAGHETTAATLAWAFERLSRHPGIVAELAREAATDGNELRQATILEVQRSRTIIDFVGRDVGAPMLELGAWRIPRGYSIVVAIGLLHANPAAFPDPGRFDPQRFLGPKKLSPFNWLAFGGGTRRCVGAAFANTEMDVVLRTVLRHFTIEPTTAPGEKWHSRGVTFTPKNGGRITVYLR
jgi:cytochrome P450